jgi:hypothetical protein
VGVVRLLRRAAELAWRQADAGGPRSSHQLLALGIDSAADEASGLLPRRARLDGAHPSWGQPNGVGQNYLLGMRIRSISNALLKVASRPGSTEAYYEARLIEADQ